MLNPDIGSIVLWQGAIVDIPAGWSLCNGLNSTPDLRDQMVVGSTGIYAQDQIGGNVQHPHDLDTDGHYHVIPAGDHIKSGYAVSDNADGNVDSATSDLTATQPPYYSLAYIMFIGD